MMRRILTWAAWAAIATSIGACALFMQSPSVRIAGVRVGGIGLQGATAEIELEVANPNRFSLTSKGLDYTLAFEEGDAGGGRWQTIAEGASEEVLTVAGEDTSRITLGVPFRYEDVGRALLRLRERGELQYRLTGGVRFDGPLRDVRVPFEKTGDIGL